MSPEHHSDSGGVVCLILSGKAVREGGFVPVCEPVSEGFSL